MAEPYKQLSCHPSAVHSGKLLKRCEEYVYGSLGGGCRGSPVVVPADYVRIWRERHFVLLANPVRLAYYMPGKVMAMVALAQCCSNFLHDQRNGHRYTTEHGVFCGTHPTCLLQLDRPKRVFSLAGAKVQSLKFTTQVPALYGDQHWQGVTRVVWCIAASWHPHHYARGRIVSSLRPAWRYGTMDWSPEGKEPPLLCGGGVSVSSPHAHVCSGASAARRRLTLWCPPARSSRGAGETPEQGYMFAHLPLIEC